MTSLVALLLLGLSGSGLLAACSSSASTPGDGDARATDPSSTPAKPGESEPSKEIPKDPSTALVVGVDAEDFRSGGFTVGQLEVTVTVDGLIAAKETLLASSGPLFPHELKLLAPKAKLDAEVVIDVVLRDRPDETMPPILRRRATTRFVPGATKLAYVFLEVRCNSFPLLGGGGPSTPACDAALTCVAGRCAAPDLPALEDYRADWSTNPPSACGTGAPEISEVAQGETSFDPLPDGATIVLEEGPQCGHHLWLGLRMKNLTQSGTVTTLSATQPGSAVVVPATAFPYAYGAAAGGACELPGIRFQVDIAGAKASDFLGKPLVVKFDLKDKAGRTATATRRVNVASEMKVTPGRNCGSPPNG